MRVVHVNRHAVLLTCHADCGEVLTREDAHALLGVATRHSPPSSSTPPQACESLRKSTQALSSSAPICAHTSSGNADQPISDSFISIDLDRLFEFVKVWCNTLCARMQRVFVERVFNA
jgi:hypothetical protein